LEVSEETFMQDKKNNAAADKKQNEKEHVIEAHSQADKDLEKDPDLNTRPQPGDDLDEGELARFESEE
jgi:hypothetical protein